MFRKKERIKRSLQNYLLERGKGEAAALRRQKQVWEIVRSYRNELEACIVRKCSRRVIERRWWSGERREGLTFWHRNFTFNSNKSSNLCNNLSVYYPDVCLQLHMFRAFSRPSLGAQWLQWQPLVLLSYRGNSRAVFVVGPAGPTTNTARQSLRYEGKTRGCHSSHWADDRRENARNMWSCK